MTSYEPPKNYIPDDDDQAFDDFAESFQTEQENPEDSTHIFSGNISKAHAGSASDQNHSSSGSGRASPDDQNQTNDHAASGARWESSTDSRNEQVFMESLVRTKLNSSASIPGYGGWLIRTSKPNGEISVFFVVKGMEKQERLEAIEWYEARTKNLLRKKVNFMYYNNKCCVIDDYTIFEFPVDKGQKSLYEYIRDGSVPDLDNNSIMISLLTLLLQYQKVTNRPTSLACISAETVFISEDGSVELLPLRSHNHEYPFEVPDDGLLTLPDLKTDVFSIAMVQTEYNSRSTDRNSLKLPGSNLLLSMLYPIRSWRPAPDEALDYLLQDHPVPPDPIKFGERINKWKKKIHDSVSGAMSDKVKEHMETSEDTDETQTPSGNI